jgi:hypothetical protein
MSHEDDKVKHSRRLLKDHNAVNKQVKIARQFGITESNRSLQQPHRLEKHHVLNCGNPRCLMCSNPRRTFKEKTIQEKRFEQKERIADED